MRVIIDRFEGEYAVCEKEDKSFINVHRSKLPKESKESDCLIIEGESIYIDIRETLDRKNRISKLMNDLFE